MAAVSIERMSNVAVVTVNNPPVNALSHDVRAGLLAAVHSTESDAKVDAVVLFCQGRTFIAGADVREFDQPAKPPDLSSVIGAIEDSAKPWLAAIHGTALGGGLEVALGCRFRVVDKNAKLGLPEVHLGLVPGAGGTVRLPRLVGPEMALQMISSGKPVDANRALECGLADEVVPDDLLRRAVAFALTNRSTARARLLDQPVAAIADPDQWEQAKTAIKTRARGQTSPLAAIEAVENACSLTAKRALEKEREIFMRLKASPQSAALRYIFFAERSVGKVPVAATATALPLTTIGVVGGGTMGAGIAAACLMAGYDVRMLERDATALATGRERVAAIINSAVDRRIISPETAKQQLSGMGGGTVTTILGDANMVIEAVFEDMAIKKQVFRDLDLNLRGDVILASNTSYLDIGELAGAVSNPGRVLGLHFFSPAHIMKLLEVIRHRDLDDAVWLTAIRLAKSLGKIALPSGIGDGFIANRMMSSYRDESDIMLTEGALPAQIDAAMVTYGFAMGIFAMQDLAGLDIGWARRKRLAAAGHRGVPGARIADRLCELGRFGRKTGKGWYDYGAWSQGRADPVVERIIIEETERLGGTRLPFTAPGIIERILSRMFAEGQAILAEGIAASPAAIDVAMVNGFGFPRWRGGPMYLRDGKNT